MDTACVDRDGTPAYVTLVGHLRREIANGTYPAGSKLPSTKQLMEKHGVSLTTARRAIQELRHAGLVVGQQGSGVFVRQPGAQRSPSLEERVADLERRMESVEQDR